MKNRAKLTRDLFADDQARTSAEVAARLGCTPQQARNTVFEQLQRGKLEIVTMNYPRTYRTTVKNEPIESTTAYAVRTQPASVWALGERA